MPTNTTAYSVGDEARLTFTVLSTAGAGANTSVTFIVNPPTGAAWVRSAGPTTAGTTAINHTATGVWQADYLITEPGRHTFAMRSTGTVTLTTDGAFTARALGASS